MIGIIQAPIVVLGATGTVGRGAVAAAAATGAPVFAVARDAGRLRALRRAHPGADIRAFAFDIRGDEDAARLAASLARALRRSGVAAPAGVVDALGAPVPRGRVLDRLATRTADAIAEALCPRLALARHLLPLLAGDSRALVIVGGPGDRHPWAGYGARSVVAGALRMLAAVLHDEAAPRGGRVHLLAVDAPVKRGLPGDCDCPQWPTARAVGDQALALLRAPRARLPAVVPFAHAASRPAPPSAMPDARALLDRLRPPAAR